MVLNEKTYFLVIVQKHSNFVTSANFSEARIYFLKVEIAIYFSMLDLNRKKSPLLKFFLGSEFLWGYIYHGVSFLCVFAMSRVQ